MSDVVIYRSRCSSLVAKFSAPFTLVPRAERLHNDMFYFLGDAATAYNKHFQVLEPGETLNNIADLD